MTQRIIIIILFLVTVSLGSNNARAGKMKSLTPITGQTSWQIEIANENDMPSPVKSQPLMPAQNAESPHGKAAKAPQLEELPHIHRYHRERVNKTVAQHTKFWFLGQMIVVLCQLSLLFIAYLHVTH